MAVTATLSKATKQRLVYVIAGDGAATTLSITNATLLADAQAGPLKGVLRQTFASQAAARGVIGGGNVQVTITPRTLGGLFAVDTDVSANKAILSVIAPATLATAVLVIEFKHSPNL